MCTFGALGLSPLFLGLGPTLRGPHPSGPRAPLLGTPTFFWVWPRTLWGPTMTHTRSRYGLAQIGWVKVGWAKIGFGQNWIWPKLAGPKTRWSKMDWPKIGLAQVGQSGWPKRDWPKSVPSPGVMTDFGPSRFGPIRFGPILLGHYVLCVLCVLPTFRRTPLRRTARPLPDRPPPDSPKFRSFLHCARLRVPGLHKNHQNSSRRPQRKTKRAKMGREREKKNAKFWASHPSGPHFSGPPPFGILWSSCRHIWRAETVFDQSVFHPNLTILGQIHFWPNPFFGQSFFGPNWCFRGSHAPPRRRIA